MPLPNPEPGTVDELACEYVRLVLDHDPVTATSLGLHDRDGELPPVTPATLDAYRRDLSALSRRVRSLDTNWDDAADVDRRGLQALLQATLITLEAERPHERNPMEWAQTPASAVLLLLLRPQAVGEGFTSAVTARTAAVPAFLASARATLRPEDIPSLWAVAARESALGGAAFFRQVLPNTVPDAAEAGEAAAEALHGFAAWLDVDVMPVARGDFALGEQPLGRLLREAHLLDDTPAALHDRGQALLAHFDGLMVEHTQGKDWSDAFAAAKADHPPKEGLLPAYRAEFEQLRAVCVEQGLVTDPGVEARLTATPEFLRPVMSHAAYLPPGPFDTAASGELWITPPASDEGLEDHSYGAIAPTTAHEGYPGHHLQMTSVNALASPVRKLHISNLMVEGWGLYVEELMAEVGYYDHAARLVQLSLTKLRASRIVVDMALHSGAMGVDEAIDRLMADGGLSADGARSEILRYTMMPTQPSTYLLGAEEIRRIRARLQDRDPGFSLRSFHDQLLACGHLPPALAAELLGATDPQVA